MHLAVISTTLLKFSPKPSRPGRLHIWGIGPCAPSSGWPGVGAPPPQSQHHPLPRPAAALERSGRPASAEGRCPTPRPDPPEAREPFAPPATGGQRAGREGRVVTTSRPRAPPPGGASPAWRGHLAAGKAGPARGPSVSSQRLNRDGIYLANKFNDQFVLVTVALPQINYSKFKYNHWLILTHSGHSEQFIPPSELPPAPLPALGGERPSRLEDPGPKTPSQVSAVGPRGGRSPASRQVGPAGPAAPDSAAPPKANPALWEPSRPLSTQSATLGAGSLRRDGGEGRRGGGGSSVLR